MSALLASPLVLDAIANLALGGLIFALVTLLFRAVKMQRRADVRFTVWFIALAALALAFPAWRIGAQIHAAPRVDIPRANARAALGLRATAMPAVASAHVVARDLDAVPRALSVDDVLVLVWLAGAIVLCARSAIGVLYLRASLKGLPAIDERRLARGTVRIVVTDIFSVPAAVGYRTPTIMLPRRAAALEATELEQIVQHELTHLRRFDDVTSLLQLFAASLVWFNPFAYAIVARLGQEREMACDEAVVARTGARRSYMGALCTLGTAERAPAYVAAFGNGSSLLPRLENLAARTPAASARAAALLLATAVSGSMVALAAAAGTPRLFDSARASEYARVDLRNGDSLVVGLRDRDGMPATHAQLYDARGRRIALVAMGVPRWGVTVTPLANGDALILGGAARDGVSSAVEIYRSSERRFRPAGAMLVPRIGATATLLPDGRVLIAGGMRGAGAYVRATEIFDMRTGRSVRTADGDGRLDQHAVLVGNGVLMYGGRMSDHAARCAILYDLATGSYRSMGRVVRYDRASVVSRRANGALVTYAIPSG